MAMMKKVMLMFTLALMIPFAAASRETYMYEVGDSDENGWRPGLNYTDWASEHHFYVGDALSFGYDPNMYDVLRVYQMDYEACRSDNPIANLTGGAGHDVFTFTFAANSLYFLSSGGNCYLGMKLAVTVEEFSSDEAPTTSSNGTSSSNGTAIIPPPPPPSPAHSSNPTMRLSLLVFFLCFVMFEMN